MSDKLIKNAAKCFNCGDVIESKHRHDFVTCSCGDLSVDGGLDYARRGFKSGASWREESLYIEVEEQEHD